MDGPMRSKCESTERASSCLVRFCCILAAWIRTTTAGMRRKMPAIRGVGCPWLTRPAAKAPRMPAECSHSMQVLSFEKYERGSTSTGASTTGSLEDLEGSIDFSDGGRCALLMPYFQPARRWRAAVAVSTLGPSVGAAICLSTRRCPWVGTRGGAFSYCVLPCCRRRFKVYLRVISVPAQEVTLDSL